MLPLLFSEPVYMTFALPGPGFSTKKIISVTRSLGLIKEFVSKFSSLNYDGLLKNANGCKRCDYNNNDEEVRPSKSVYCKKLLFSKSRN